jgi:DNA polymerase-3 subunit beta
MQHVVNSRTTLPILSNTLIEACDGELKFIATDLDTGVSCSVDAEVHVRGATTLPARKLLSIIKEVPAETVDVEVDGTNTATIRSGASYFRILGLSRDEFPPLPDFETGSEFKIDQRLLADSLKKTAYAISTDQTRYVLNGIHCVLKNNSMTMVATDGRRLALVEEEIELPESQETSFIIPAKAVGELQRMLGGEGEVRVRINEGRIEFDVNRKLLVSKLIEGTYPNFRQVIPGETRYRMTVEREALMRTVTRVSLLTSEKANSIKFRLEPNELEILAQSPEIGEAKESMMVKYNGPPLQIAFNPAFLLAPLRNLDTDEVHLDLIDEMSPGLIRTVGSFLYVIMPMRSGT